MASEPKSTLPLRFGRRPELSHFALLAGPIVSAERLSHRRDHGGDQHKAVFVSENVSATLTHPYAGRV